MKGLLVLLLLGVFLMSCGGNENGRYYYIQSKNMLLDTKTGVLYEEAELEDFEYTWVERTTDFMTSDEHWEYLKEH